MRTAEASVAPLWFRVVFPSVTDLIFIVLLFAMAAGTLAPRLLGDAGIGWHIRNGEIILRTHAITRSDPFSSSMSGHPWYAWEWLYDLGISVVHGWWGLNGVVFVSAVIITLTLAIVFRLTLHRGSLLVSAFLLLLTFGASAIHLFARPHILSWLCAVIWFQILDSAETAPPSSSYRRLFWLPVLMLLWANLHGGFVTGFVLLGLYMSAATVNFFRLKTITERQNISRWLRRLLTISGLSLVASLVNPYGYKLHAHVYAYLSNRWLMDNIDEFLSPNFHGLAQQCFVGMLLITLVTFVVSRERPRLSAVLIVLFAAYSGMYASRNLPLSSMLLMMIAGPLLSKSFAAPRQQFATWLQRLCNRCNSFDLRMRKLEDGFRWHLWPVAAMILGVVICSQGGRLGRHQAMNAHFDAKRFPLQAAELIAEKNIHEPIFSQDSWGGYLIYRLYPQNKVFVDDRHDFYGEKFLKDYLQIVRATPEWKEKLDQNGAAWMLAPADSSLASLLRESPQWKLIHEDETAALFQKQSEK